MKTINHHLPPTAQKYISQTLEAASRTMRHPANQEKIDKWRHEMAIFGTAVFPVLTPAPRPYLP